MPSRKIPRNIAVENCAICKERIAPASVRTVVLYCSLDGSPDELSKRHACRARTQAGKFFQPCRQDDGGALHNYVYIIAYPAEMASHFHATSRLKSAPSLYNRGKTATP